MANRARSKAHARRRPESDGPRAASVGPVAARGPESTGTAAAGPGSAQHFDPTGMLALQSAIGNHEVASLISRLRSGPRAVQRSVISMAADKETIYNEVSSTDSQYEPHQYGTAKKFEMTRSGSSVDVTVKIRFVDQARGTRAKLPDGTDDPSFKQGVGAKTEIPAGDERRAWASEMCGKVVGFWNGKFVLKSKTKAQPGTGAGSYAPPLASTDIKLPINFSAKPVFDISATDYHKEIRLFGSGQAAGAAGHPIDAGNYYMNAGSYGGSSIDEEKATYAHEYGHLLGINDEYSRSNFQMHLLMHKVSKSEATRMNKELDKETTKRMVLAGLRPQLLANVGTMGDSVAGALSEMRGNFEKELAAGIRNGWRDGAVIDDAVTQIGAQLTKPENADLLASLRKTVKFEATENLSNITYAQQILDTDLDPATVQAVLSQLYKTAINAAIVAPFDIHSKDAAGRDTSMNVTLDLSSPLQPAATGGLPAVLNTAATTIADQSAGKGATTDASGALVPPMAPAGSLLDGLTGLPARWKADGEGLADFVEGAKMAQYLSAYLTNYLVTNDMSTAATVGEMYRRIFDAFQSVTLAAGQSLVRTFFASGMVPVIDDQITAIRDMVGDEADRIGGAATLPARAGGPDPLLDAVAQMQLNMRNTLAAQTTAGTKAEPAVGSATQAVRYDVNSLMGNVDEGTAVRQDYLDPLVKQFNLPANGLINSAAEEDFHSETR